MTDLRLYLLQRASAALMLPLIVIHLIVIYYATAKGLTAADVLSRTRGSLAWGTFYTLFVGLAAVHAAIGVRVILREWTSLAASARDGIAITFALALLLLGLRAVAAVVLP